MNFYAESRWVIGNTPRLRSLPFFYCYIIPNYQLHSNYMLIAPKLGHKFWESLLFYGHVP